MVTVQPPAPAGTTDAVDFTVDELRLATRNHGMPLEALRYDVTPVGLHYLLVHYDIPDVDLATWSLTVSGEVGRPVLLGLDDLRARPRVTREVTMECAGNGRARLQPRTLSQPWLHEAVGTGRWTGTPLADLLAEVGVSRDAVAVVFTGADRGREGGVEQHYQRALSVADAIGPDVLLAYELNGAPLPPQHGFPLRLVVPGWYGMTSVKWLTSIEVVDRPFEGYQHQRSYRSRQAPEDPGVPVERMAVRSLMVPPGVPDFATRWRLVDHAPCELAGRAWSGTAPIERVEVSTDDGVTWEPAHLTPPSDPRSWTAWRYEWRPRRRGDHVLCCRATDADGNTQPDTPVWNLGGYAVNAVQRVDVTVR